MEYDRENVIASCSEKILDILKHSIAVIHSSFKTILSDKRGLKKFGSLPKTAENTLINTEDQLKLVLIKTICQTT